MAARQLWLYDVYERATEGLKNGGRLPDEDEAQGGGGEANGAAEESAEKGHAEEGGDDREEDEEEDEEEEAADELAAFKLVVHFFAALARSTDATIQQVALEVGGQRVALNKLRAVSEQDGSGQEREASQSLDHELDLAKLGEAVRLESARVLKVSQGQQRITIPYRS